VVRLEFDTPLFVESLLPDDHRKCLVAWHLFPFVRFIARPN